MTFLDAIILGIVEGLTEFLPVSSTGHLLLTNSLLGLQGPGVNAYTIVIQGGALFAVMIHYRARLLATARQMMQPGTDGFRLLTNLFIAFLPAAVVGLLAEDFIDTVLMNSDLWIGAALIIGGMAMIAIEKVKKPDETATVTRIEDIRPKDALIVGFAQCFALWPGMSRSMSTIVGGQLRGFSNHVAADFSFLLALPTLGAATIYKMISDREDLMQIEGGLPVMGVGIVVSFLVAWAAIAVFLKFLKKTGMTPFGIHRILVGAVIFWVLLT